MMKRKKIIWIMAACAALGVMAGCGSGGGETTAATEAQTTAGETESSSAEAEESGSAEAGESSAEEAAAEAADGEGKTLVVYYSATGNTENVANYIADITGGDLFELEPVEPYTDEDLNWTDENSRVSMEQADESLRDVELVSATVDGFEDYDTIFIGYPIWWGIAAWPVDQFVESNDFTGKTVIPFCTSSSSGLGQSGELLAEMAGTGDWVEGMRFNSGAVEADVQEWIDSLGL